MSGFTQEDNGTKIKMVKRLINQCEKELSFRGSTVPTNMVRSPLYPLVNVIWKTTPEDAEPIIRETMKGVLGFGIEGEEVTEFVSGENSPEKLNQEIRSAFVKLKRSPLIKDKSSSVIAHYLNILSDSYESELQSVCEAFRSRDTGFLGAAYLLVFVICDDDSCNRMKVIKQRIEKTTRALEPFENARAIYLGDQLQDGSLLSEKNENYRVAADIAMLSVMAPDAKHAEPSGVIRWMVQPQNRAFTAAYLRMKKPVTDITKVMLHKIIEKRISIAAQNKGDLVSDKHAHESATQFFSAAGISHTSLECLENAFMKCIYSKLPTASSLEFLPNWKKASKGDNYANAAGKTEGFLDLYVQRYFTEVGSNLENVDVAEVCDEFIQSLSKTFDYQFVAAHFISCTKHLEEIRPAGEREIYATAVFMAKKAFYDAMRPKLQEAMCRYAETAMQFSSLLNMIKDALRVPPMPMQQGVRPVDVFYESETEKHVSGAGESLIRVIHPEMDSWDVCDQLSDVFRTIINKEPALFHASLEEELLRRADIPGADNAPHISTVLDEPQVRQQNRINATEFGEKKEYYIYYNGAGFADTLSNKEGHIVTGCVDSAEKLIICVVSPDSIIG